MIDKVGQLQKAGATIHAIFFKSETVDHYLEQLSGFKEKVAPSFA